jgi:CBS domain containing-hemolysin-like protein
LLGVLAILLFVALNGFFVAAEFALVKLRATYQGGKEPAADDLVGQAVSKIDRYLSVTQLGITLASLGLGWIGEPAIAVQVRRAVVGVIGHEPGPGLETGIFAVSFAILTFAHVLLGELVPKLVAIQRSAAVAAFSVWPLRISYYLLWPGLFLLESSSRAILGRLGLTLHEGGEAAMSEEEIIGILAVHVARGHSAADKQELVKRMIRFSQRTAKQAMVPRVDVLYVPIDIPGASALEFLRAHEYSRVPLSKGEELDEVVGYLYWKDFLRDARNVKLPSLLPLRRDVLFVPETQGLVDVLRKMQKEQTPFAMVVDEYGGVSGLITMEDLLEEIVGEIKDELDEEALRVEKRGEDTWEVDAGVQLDELEHHGIGLGEHEVNATVGGAVQKALGHIPRVGDRGDLGDGVKFEVLLVVKRRVLRVRLVVPKPKVEE